LVALAGIIIVIGLTLLATAPNITTVLMAHAIVGVGVGAGFLGDPVMGRSVPREQRLGTARRTVTSSATGVWTPTRVSNSTARPPCHHRRADVRDRTRKRVQAHCAGGSEEQIGA
jgi:hypothetical protein